MVRDITQARGAMKLVVADLRRVLGATWSCELSDDWVLTVSAGARAEPTLLDNEVADDTWYSEATWTPGQQREALAVEATDAVASEVLEMLRVLGPSRLTCSEHGADLGACESVWCCEAATATTSHSWASSGPSDLSRTRKAVCSSDRWVGAS